MNFDKELNARGLSCPLPIVKTKKALVDMASGQILKVISTDTGSVKDMA
ncbi:MAG: sulfurtransferase TusA family protein, partial [Sideroxydans sp.]|nr:sulfurtransferase TusA family protein [Sideroxydans sp.]